MAERTTVDTAVRGTECLEFDERHGGAVNVMPVIEFVDLNAADIARGGRDSTCREIDLRLALCRCPRV
jgi:hypothetical protein